jgi:hypothetical protein
MKTIFFFALIFLVSTTAKSQAVQNCITRISLKQDRASYELHKFLKTDSRRVNVFIFTRERKKKIDLLSFYTLLRARVKSLFHHNKFYVVNARSAKDASAKVRHILLKKQSLINSIWFDSHGHYGNRYSSFRIGTDQFNYKNIRDSNAIHYLQTIAHYCDEHTKVGLGSCYAGADFYFPATDSTPATRMNGDSLMIGVGNIFRNSFIYASESWVMAKPGIFKNRYGFAGYPLNKKFKDKVYAPVWERIGKWRQYSLSTGQILNVPTIALDNRGNINVNKAHYNTGRKAKNKIGKVSKQLRAGLAHFS